MKKVLVTGGTGIIGVNLINRLKQNPDLDIDSHSSSCYSLLYMPSCKRIGGAGKYDIIYHLAGYGQPKKFNINPELTHQLNTTAIHNLLQRKLKSNGRFIFMSTSEIYNGGYSNKETDAITLNPSNPRGCYTSGKLCGEEILRYSGVNATVIRICLAYGPGFKVGDTRVLYELVHKALTTGCINLMDQGLAFRNYIYIDDALDMLFKILDKKQKGFQLYNIGGKQSIRIIDVAHIISELTGAKVIPGPASGTLVGSPDFAGVNIDKFEDEYGPQSFVDIKTGIRNCIEWYRSIL